VTTATSTPTVIVGAGPYGLSIAAHLRARGVPVRIFGDVMASWRHNMPVGAFLKSTPSASSLSAPTLGFTLADFCRTTGVAPLDDDQIVPVDLYIRYGLWFHERLVPDVESAKVCHIANRDRRFQLKLDSGEELEARTVVLATGLTGSSYIPPELRTVSPELPSVVGLLSHSSQHQDLSRFSGRNVAVIGAGQSALESAALLCEAGAHVRVLARGQARFGAPPNDSPRGPIRLPTPYSPLGPAWSLYALSRAPGMFRYLPRPTRLYLVKNVLGPLGAWWLRDRVVGRFPILSGQRIEEAHRDGEEVVLTLASPQGPTSIRVDHVLAATGYRVDLEELGFLSADLVARLKCVAGSPRLSASFESSVSGLFFTGLAAAATFGPVMRFVCGAGFAARRLSVTLAGQGRDDQHG
jgi:hypothetical protein